MLTALNTSLITSYSQKLEGFYPQQQGQIMTPELQFNQLSISHIVAELT